MKSRQYDKAVECYTEGLNIDKDNFVLYSNRSAAYLSAEKIDEAYADAVKCISLNPLWPKGYCRKGAAEQLKGDFQSAVNTYNEGSPW